MYKNRIASLILFYRLHSLNQSYTVIIDHRIDYFINKSMLLCIQLLIYPLTLNNVCSILFNL